MGENNQRPGKEEAEKVQHVGGIDATTGGVDPDIDATLMRLSGGP